MGRVTTSVIALVSLVGCARLPSAAQHGWNPHMTPDQFITAYEAALASQDWTIIEPLVHPEACVTFSSGTVHEGRPAVQAAFTRNFTLIKGEQYKISNVRWVRKSHDYAAYLFDFTWKGEVDGKPIASAGRGTCVLVCEDDRWQMLIEHLGPRSP